MNNSIAPTTSRAPSPSINPFARALAEARGNQQSGTGTDQASDSLLNQSPRPTDFSPAQLAEQQQRQAEQQRRERLRQQLHRQINPVETQDVFNAREQQVKKEIDSIRYELKMLSQEIADFNKEIEISIMSNVAAPGIEGKYYFNFFQKLREFIQLLRAKVHSARTWATTFNSKKKKKNGKAGLEIGGQQYEQTTTIYDRMHHERSTVYSGS